MIDFIAVLGPGTHVMTVCQPCVAALDLCTHVRPSCKVHHVQICVGHYGVFSGGKWQQQIYPRVRDMVHMVA